MHLWYLTSFLARKGKSCKNRTPYDHVWRSLLWTKLNDQPISQVNGTAPCFEIITLTIATSMRTIEKRGDRIQSPSVGSAKTTVWSVGWVVQYTDMMTFLAYYVHITKCLHDKKYKQYSNMYPVLNKVLRLEGTPWHLVTLIQSGFNFIIQLY